MNTTPKTRKTNVVFLTQFSILIAIEAIFCFTPLGSLPALGPIVMTLAMIPIIVTTLLLGTKAGTLMGLITGVFSFIVWTFMPPSPIVAFVFTPFYSFGEMSGNIFSVMICIIPRILVGTVTGLSYNLLNKFNAINEWFKMMISAILGSLINTLLVMGGIWLFFGNQYSTKVGSTMVVIVITTILTNGLPEAILAGIVAPAICKPIKKLQNKNQYKRQ